MNKKHLFLLLILFVLPAIAFSQNFKFAFLSDTHIGVKNAYEDLRRSVKDINADTTLKFVIISGDITENGVGTEILQARKILSQFKKPVYVVTGNHDGNWSPSGGKSFKNILGDGRFSFKYNGYLFIGINSGPNMLHKSPGQVPREDILWMDSIFHGLKDKNIPIVYINHYPQDFSQQNWYEAIDILKKKNIQLILCGHGHVNKQYDFEGIPGIMGRSNMRAGDSTGGYNIVSFSSGNVIFKERRPLVITLPQWAETKLYNHHFINDTAKYARPSYSINKLYANVKILWQNVNSSDAGTGAVTSNNLTICTNTEGWIYALVNEHGNKKWAFQTNGKIYSTPATTEGYLVAASTDSTVYCLNVNTGKLIWKYKMLNSIVASPTINNKTLFIGSSDGHFRAIRLKDGKVLWDYGGVKDFVMTKPLIYNGKIYFGSWGSEFYALDRSTGKLAWKWTDTSFNRINAPAGCKPVGAKGKIFIVAPDQFMTAFDAANGNILWRKRTPSIRVRESIGLSKDSSEVYVKTTDGKLFAISSASSDMKSNWSVNLKIGYDVSSAPIVERKNVVYVPSNSGVVTAVDKIKQKIAWQYKISNSLVTGITLLSENKVAVITVDGKITCLQFKPDNQK